MPRKKRPALPTLIHRSVCHDRTEHDSDISRLEKAAADYWEEVNQVKSKFSIGEGQLLRRIMNPTNFDGGHTHTLVHEPEITINQDHATAAATMFQWMFTNGGTSAIAEVCKRAGYHMSISRVPKNNSPHPETG